MELHRTNRVRIWPESAHAKYGLHVSRQVRILCSMVRMDLKPSDIRRVAELLDELALDRGRQEGVEKGLGGADLELFAVRARHAFRKVPLVTADSPGRKDPKYVVARLWGRIFVDGGHWEVSGCLTRVSGRVGVGALTIAPWESGRAALTTDVLRRLPIGAIRDAALRELADRARHVDLLEGFEARSRGRIRLALSQGERESVRQAGLVANPLRPTRGRHGASIAFHEEVATDAVRAHEAGLPVYKTLARDRAAPESTVRKWIKWARLAGVLSAEPNTWVLGPGHSSRSGTRRRDAQPSVESSRDH